MSISLEEESILKQAWTMEVAAADFCRKYIKTDSIAPEHPQALVCPYVPIAVSEVETDTLHVIFNLMNTWAAEAKRKAASLQAPTFPTPWNTQETPHDAPTKVRKQRKQGRKAGTGA